MAEPRTVTTLTGQTFVQLFPAEIAEVINSPIGPVMRHLIVLGEKVKQEAIRIAPKRTGNLSHHIVKRVVRDGGTGAVLVGVENVPYAIWVHEGSQPHTIRPRKGTFLVFTLGANAGAEEGNVVFAREVHHPGNRPNRFLVRALKAVQG